MGKMCYTTVHPLFYIHQAKRVHVGIIIYTHNLLIFEGSRNCGILVRSQMFFLFNREHQPIKDLVCEVLARPFEGTSQDSLHSLAHLLSDQLLTIESKAAYINNQHAALKQRYNPSLSEVR